ncbi:MAG: phage protease [bacterium]
MIVRIEHSTCFNRAFKKADDDWYQVMLIGEFPTTLNNEKETDITMLVDQAAMDAIMAQFGEDKQQAHWPGYLLDYEHFSLQKQKRSEAAGWIDDLQVRDDGLFAHVKWTARGQADVEGGVYRNISPVAGLSRVKGDQYRASRFLGAGLTNTPNLRGMVPLSNRRDMKSADEKTGASIMNYKEVLCRVLGQPPEATDEQLQSAVDAHAQNTVKKSDHDVVVAANKALTAELIESDLETHKAVIVNRDAMKTALTANREGTLAVLKSIRPAGATALNRADSRTPGGKQGDEADGNQNGLVRSIMRRDGCSFDAAWNTARREKPDLFTKNEEAK